ncbi:MAG: hypothetical protein JNL74_00855, partial [Fibrobacteres bacterium]|nr:hypothetical protein [Fibrobacterota bacterium]
MLIVISLLLYTYTYSQQFDNLQITAGASSPAVIQDTNSAVIFPGANIPISKVIVFTSISDTILLTAKARDIASSETRDIAVTWRLSNNNVVENGAFPLQPSIRLSAIRSVKEDTLIATYGSGITYMTDTIRFRVLPAYANEVVLYKGDTSLTAGDTFRFSLHLIDARGDSVTDPSRLPDSISVYASKNEINLSNGNILTLANLKVPYKGSLISMPGFVPIKSSGSNKIVVSLYYHKNVLDGRSWGDTIELKVNAASPKSMVVHRGGTTNIPTVDKITTFGTDIASGQVVYDVKLYDKFNNMLDSTRSEYGEPGVSRQISGTAIDTAGFMTLRNHHIYSRTGNETGGYSRVTFLFTPLIGQQASISCSIQVVQVVGMKDATTHEWVADPVYRRAEALKVIKDVLGLNPDSVAPSNIAEAEKNSRITSTLARYGYSTKRDGFLDYIDLRLATAYPLKDSMITRIFFGRGRDTLFWEVTDTGYFVQLPQRTKILPLDSLDSEGGCIRWRVWLISHAKYPSKFSMYETGFLPVITFNNENSNLLSSTPYIGGTEILWTIPDSIVIDSAAPVISRFSFVDNACNKDNPENTVRIGFSEPVRYAGMPSLSANKSFVLINSSVNDSSFLSSTIVREFKRDLLIDDDSLEAWNYIGREQYMMMWELVILPDSNSSFRYNHTQIRFSLDTALTALADINGNVPTAVVGNTVILSSERGVPPYLCDAQGLTICKIEDAVLFNHESGSNAPLFPWFGASINMQSLDLAVPRKSVIKRFMSNGRNFVVVDYDTLASMITISVLIFDAMGTPVASSSTHPVLKSEINMSRLRAFLNLDEVQERVSFMSFKELQSHYDIRVARSPVEPDTLKPLYPPTVNLGYDFIMSQKNSFAKPLFPMPAWNGTNSRGRIVAPGGYI